MKTVTGRQGSAANSGVSGAEKTGHSSGQWSFQQLTQHHMHCGMLVPENYNSSDEHHDRHRSGTFHYLRYKAPIFTFNIPVKTAHVTLPCKSASCALLC
jgi:hypothetical protein